MSGALGAIFEHGPFRVERGRAVLAEITDLGVMAQITFPLLELHHSGQNLEQRRFARAVRSHQYGLAHRVQSSGPSPIDLVRSIGHMNPF